MIVNNTLVAKNIVVENINITTDNVKIAGKTLQEYVDERIKTILNSKLLSMGLINQAPTSIVSPIVETTDLIATGSAKIASLQTNEIKPENKDIVINLGSSEKFGKDQNKSADIGYQNNSDKSDLSDISGLPISSDESRSLPNSSENKGPLARLIIRGLEGKTVTTIDAAGNASFSGQLVADSLQINNDATISGNLASNTLTTNEASISGTLIADRVDAENINDLTKTVFDQRQSLTEQTSSINDIQKLLADIKNQPTPDPKNYQNIDSNVRVGSSDPNTGEITSPLQNLTVTGNANLYTVSVSNSLLVGTTLFENNTIISLAPELKLSALSQINLLDGAVIIAKDGTITTRGELIAEGGIRTDEIKSLTDDGQVSIKNLTINNLTIDKISTNSAIIAAADNFDKNGIFAPAIESATASAGLGILPANQSEIIIYNDRVSADSLIYLTPTSSNISVSQLTVGQKENCLEIPNQELVSGSVCKNYFKIVTNTSSTLPIKFNWLIIN